MKLNDPIIKAAKPKDKPYKLSDGDGLVLLINPNGSKWWRYRYRFNGKEKMLSIGTYPEVTLKKARDSRVTASDLLTQGIDPSENRKEQKQQEAIAAENSFESVARQWWNHWKHGRTERHAGYTIRRLEADVFPGIGNKPINEITAATLLTVIKKIEARGALDIAKRALTMCGQVFRYAVAHGLAERNPAADIKPSDVLKSTKKTNYASLNEKELPELLRRIDAYDGQPLTKLALQLMAYTFVRTGELIGARWQEIDLDKKEWRIPAERMKMKTPHIVPLSLQAITVLEEIKALSTDETLLFPSERRDGKTMSNNTILYAIYRMGYHSRMTGHGFRSIASTILHEQGYNHEHIELQLAHSKRDAVSAAYNHALYLEPRARMMQDWADYLEAIKTGATILQFNAIGSS
ncbi:integrase arm-type DNA-binding domain-containing protein [Nitrosomonas sp. Nm166]|uniref:tyrosine-type recombinase/integrase n=1 Tax=Nitrosomonas sp. Nm166 TaxID=1881054 RepID=UPI0008EF40AC|nr:integrase arm-type DNA-binding domain-containing protein [Nitrosomonas sp. Nm166]SFE41147.1 Integrase [Nitrosomonas sp. Nm166]